MNRLFTLIASVVITVASQNNAIAQCTINNSDTTTGFLPRGLPCVEQGTLYGQAVQLHVPETYDSMPATSFTITGITGLPQGIAYAINPDSATINAGNTGCIWFSGTTTSSASDYPLVFNVTINVDGSYTDTTLNSLDMAYALSVCGPNNVGGNCDTIEDYPLAQQPVIYQLQYPEIGYVTGDNNQGLTAVAEAVNPVVPGSQIGGAFFSFGVLTINPGDSDNMVIINVIAGDTSNSEAPGATISTDSFPLRAIVPTIEADAANLLYIAFTTPPTISDTIFYVAVQFPTDSGDTIALWSSPLSSVGNAYFYSTANTGWYSLATLTGNANYNTDVLVGAWVCGHNGGPVADFAVSSPLGALSSVRACNSDSVNFVDESAGAIANWSWSFPGGTPAISNLQNPSVYYATPGTFSVTLTVTDSSGLQNAKTLTNYVTIGTPPAVTVATQHVCPALANNGSAIATVNGGSAPYNYLWSTQVSDNAVSGLAPGSYLLTVTDANNCIVVDTIQITVGTEDTIYQSNGVCAGDSFNFYGTWLYTAGVYHDTLPGNLTCDTLVVLTLISGPPVAPTYIARSICQGDSFLLNGIYYSSSGTDTAHFTLSTGCDSMVILQLTVNLLPGQGITGYQGSCRFDTLDAGNPGCTYYWNTGDTTKRIIVTNSGTYSVVVTNAGGCAATFYYTYISSYNSWDYYTFLNETDANCSDNGTATANVYGGSYPYTFNWSNGDTTAAVTSLGAGNYIVTVTDSTGCSITGNTIVSMNCYSVISGYAFIDSNQNCIFDSTETPAFNTVVSAATGNGQIYYGSTDGSGFYSINVPDTGIYYLQIYESDNAICANVSLCGNASQTVTIITLGDTSLNNNFAFTNVSGFDLTMHPGWTAADPGFQQEYWVMPYNQSPVPFTGTATVIFTYDSNLIYQYSLAPLPAVDTVAHTLTWVVNNVPSPSYNWNNVRFQNFFLVPASLSLDYLLQSDFTILPYSGDCDTSNNHLRFCESLFTSHDPNEKDVQPASNISPDDSVLTYTIHFQNTGSDSTNFIIVKDTLTPNLNAATVRNIASSYKYSDFTISGQGILTWTFNPYQLPDSATNANASKGFIIFTVNKKSNLPLGTIINNTASIYFDYNQPVVTNEVTDTVSYPTGIAAAANSDNSIHVEAYPNPFSQFTNFVVTGLNQTYNFELYDITGRLVTAIRGIQGTQFKLSRNNLDGAVYLYSIISGGEKVANGKLVIE